MRPDVELYFTAELSHIADAMLEKMASVPKSLVEEAAKDHRLAEHVGTDEEHYRHPIKDPTGQVVGFFTPRESNGGIRTGAIYITPEARGKGYGSKALREYIGDKGARAFVNHDNEASQRMFQAAGFQKTDPEERWGGGHWWRTPAEVSRKTKVGYVAKTPTMRAKVQAEKHFDSPDPNWPRFEKNLKKKSFQDVVSKDSRSDDKLKKYVENYGGYLRSKKVTAKITSPDTGKPYVIKELPGGRLGCSCGNWQYRKSVDGGDCKHIEAITMKKVSFAEKVKIAYLGSLAAVAAGGTNLGINRTLLGRAKRKADESAEATRQLKAMSAPR